MSRFSPSRTFERDLRNDSDFKRMLAAEARAVADEARALAPVDQGDYRAALRADANRVIADDRKALWIEFGTGPPAPTPAYAPLRRAARRRGLQFVARQA